MPEIGNTADGRCVIMSNVSQPLSLFLVREPQPSCEGYFVFLDRVTTSQKIDCRADKLHLKRVRFDGRGPDDKPGRIDWSLVFPKQDTQRPNIHTSFEITGKVVAYFSPDFINYQVIVHARDPEDWHYYFCAQGLDVEAQPVATLRAGGRLTYRIQILSPTVCNRTQFLIGPVQDSYGNVLQCWFSNKDRQVAVTIREREGGPILYSGTADLKDNQLSFQIDQLFPETSVFRLEFNLGPLGGAHVIEGRLHDPQYQYQSVTINSAHFVIHAPAAYADKGKALSEKWEKAYDGVCRWFPHEPQPTEEKHFFIDPYGSWASLQGQEMFWQGFVSWHPKCPAYWGSCWEALSLHEIGHRLESELFRQVSPESHLQGIKNETVASLIRLLAVEALHGKRFVKPHQQTEGAFFFDYLENPETAKAPKADNLRFVVQSYLPKRFGASITKGFFAHWVETDAILRPRGYNSDEAYAALYSVMAGENLWWIFDLCGFAGAEARIASAMELLPATWRIGTGDKTR